MGSGCCPVYPAPPSPARPLHCGSCWALGRHNRLSGGTDGRPFRRRHKKTAKVGGPRCLREPARRAAGDPEPRSRWRRDEEKGILGFVLIVMQRRV